MGAPGCAARIVSTTITVRRSGHFASAGRAASSVIVQTLRRTVRPCESSKASKKFSAVRQSSWCNVLMKVLCDRSIGLCVVALQGQEIVAPLVPNLLRDGRLTAHRIDGHNTTFDG